MFKLLIVLPIVLLGMALLGAGALVFLPLLALLPIVLAIGAVMFTFVLAIGIFAMMFRLIGALMVGVAALTIGGIGFAFILAGGAAVFAIGLLFAHLLMPLLVIAGLVWLIRRAGKPPVARSIAHG